MTKTNTTTKTSDQIANAHGCDLATRPFGGIAIIVQERWRQGDPQDDDRIRICRTALRAAGYREFT